MKVSVDTASLSLSLSVSVAVAVCLSVCLPLYIYVSYDIEHPKLFASNFQMMMKKVTMVGNLMSL